MVGAAAGVGVELNRHPHTPAPQPPRDLLDTVAAEQQLIADLDATTGGGATTQALIAQIRSDHAAHLSVLRALLPHDARQRSTRASTAPGTARTLGQLRAAETDAARSTARRAATSNGAHAALLASISACESTHAELFS